MKPFKLLAIVCSIILMCGCASLHPVSVNYHSPIDTYRYVYITPTSSLSSGTGSVYNGYGSSTTKSVNPGDIISGYLIKKGYIIVPHIQPEYASQTLIINYGQTGRRDILGGLLGYTIEITLQFLSAQTHEIVCISTAEGQGSTEADDIRIAITRALDEVFPSK